VPFWDGFPSSSDEAGEIGKVLFVTETGRVENGADDPAVEGRDWPLGAGLTGEDGRVLALTGEEGLGSARERSPKTPTVGGMRGGLPMEPSSGEGGNGRPPVKLLVRSRCWLSSPRVAELGPERVELTASCELDALAARSEEGSGRVRFQ
jgi:hypothetical protein